MKLIKNNVQSKVPLWVPFSNDIFLISKATIEINERLELLVNV